MSRSSLYVVLLAGLVGSGCAGEVGEDGGADEGVDEEALRICANGPMVPGVDVSYYQRAIDWNRVRQAGKAFAFIRVSDSGFRDPRFAENWAGAKAAGLYRGAYQYFRAGDDPVTQADILLQAINHRVEATDLPPVLDLEESDGQSRATVLRKALVWLQRVHAFTGRRPIVYTMLGYTSTIGDPDALGVYPLWVANWTTRCPSVPPAWRGWDFWQNGISRAGVVPGISTPVDLNYFNGTLAELAAYAGPGEPP